MIKAVGNEGLGYFRLRSNFINPDSDNTVSKIEKKSAENKRAENNMSLTDIIAGEVKNNLSLERQSNYVVRGDTSLKEEILCFG